MKFPISNALDSPPKLIECPFTLKPQLVRPKDVPHGAPKWVTAYQFYTHLEPWGSTSMHAGSDFCLSEKSTGSRVIGGCPTRAEAIRFGFRRMKDAGKKKMEKLVRLAIETQNPFKHPGVWCCSLMGGCTYPLRERLNVSDLGLHWGTIPPDGQYYQMQHAHYCKGRLIQLLEASK